MLVYPSGGLLHLGRAVPRAWFAQPEEFGARDVATKFGKVSVRYRPLEDGSVKAFVSFERAQRPGRLLVRFRHPEKKEWRSVRVNGAPHANVDRQKGDVDITGREGEIVVEADY